jgi:hypothetical protein
MSTVPVPPTAPPSASKNVQHRSRGPRPTFFPDRTLDDFHVILVSLLEEVSVLRDRLDTTERLLEQHGVLRRDEIEGYEPDAEVAAERDAVRDAYVQRVLRGVFEEAAQLKTAGERFDTVEDVIASMSR